MSAPTEPRVQNSGHVPEPDHVARILATSPDRRGGRRSTSFDSARAKLVAIEREARKREARARLGNSNDSAATLVIKAAKPGQVSDPAGLASAQADPACAWVADPIDLGVLVEAPDGSLTLPEPPKLPGAPRIDATPRPAPGPQARPRSSVLPPSAATVEPPARVDSGAQDWARVLAELEPVKPELDVSGIPETSPAPPDPALEAQRIARARLSMARLYEAIRSPHLARWSLPYAPEIVQTAGMCSGCQQMIQADRVSGHAVQRANARPPRVRCVAWCFRIPESQT
jgi:hypothetical protein